MNKREFDYEITQVNSQAGYFEVRYVPKQQNLAPVIRNVFATGASVETDIENAAPYNVWDAQQFLAETQLLGQSGTITPQG